MIFIRVFRQQLPSQRLHVSKTLTDIHVESSKLSYNSWFPTRQSVAVQRDGASRLAKKIPIIRLPKCVFELFLLQKWP